MRIAIDARALSDPGGGEETYIRNVISGLASIDADNTYVLFLNPAAPRDSTPDTERMRRIEVWPRNRLVRLLATIPLALLREHIDVLHAQNTIPPFSPARSVVSVHDIAYERHPEFFLPAEVRRLRMLMPLMVRQASIVLTLSEFSKWDIVRRYRVPPEKIVVAPCAADPDFRPLHDEAQLIKVRARYETGERFILSVGNLQPRKNLKSLIEAYVRLRQTDVIQHRLVLVGRKTWLYDDIFASARASGYEADMIFTGYVPDGDLVALYNAAELFVYPSIFEGFGLPPLEAMACGTPVITSNTSALPEVVGNAALTIDPHDVAAIASAINAVLSDSELRRRLSIHGLQRAHAFSWHDTARTILDVYHRVSGYERV